MPTIENYAERNFEFTQETWAEDGLKRIGGTRKIVIPKLVVENDDNGNGTEKPGTVDVSDAELSAMRSDDVAKHWFNPRALVVRDGGAAPPKPPVKKAA